MTKNYRLHSVRKKKKKKKFTAIHSYPHKAKTNHVKGPEAHTF